MSNLPDPDMKPEDVDQLIKSYGRPIDPNRKSKLMDKLREQQKEFSKVQKAKDHEPLQKDSEDELSR